MDLNDKQIQITFNESNIHKCFKNIKSGFVRIDFDDEYAPRINREFLKKQINDLYPLITITWLLNYKKTKSINESIISSSEISLNNLESVHPLFLNLLAVLFSHSIFVLLPSNSFCIIGNNLSQVANFSILASIEALIGSKMVKLFW
jgi:hypothetical protein